MERIGRYRILGELGRGAMGVVYRASDPAIGREVAIKTIRLDAADSNAREKLRERLFREARSAGVLSHPNIVTIYDMGETEVEAFGSLAWVAMGLVNGPSLEKLIAGPEPMPGARVLSILRQTAVALDYAHSRGVVHRDVKPGNVMTDEDGAVKITDFGIARFLSPEKLNETSTVTGTPNYMSPEQVQGLDIDGRTDQFSLAVVAWEILTGERPFPGDNLSTVVYRIVSEEPHPVHHLNGTLTPGVDEVLRRALSKDPADRFASCSSFVGALETACADAPGWRPVVAGTIASMPTIALDRMQSDWVKPEKPVLRPLPEPWAPAPAVARPNRTVWVMVAGGAVALATAFGAISYWADRSSEPVPFGPTTVRQSAAAAAVPQPEPRVNEGPGPATATPAETEPVAEPPKRSPLGDAETPTVVQASSRRLQDIWTESNPPGAVVVLDGNPGLSCQSPCVLHARPGVHQLIFSLDGYRLERREIRVSDAAVEVPAVNLQAVMSSLLISSVPAGASVRINGNSIAQKTPIALPLKPGSYLVTVEKDGMLHTDKVQLGESPRLLKVQLTP